MRKNFGNFGDLPIYFCPGIDEAWGSTSERRKLKNPFRLTRWAVFCLRCRSGLHVRSKSYAGSLLCR